MKRRDFLKGAGLLGGSALLSGLGTKAFAQQAESFYTQFQRELKKHPILRGWQGLSEDIAPRHFSWRGRLPKVLDGKQFYRNGPARFVLGEQRYSHWFDGDGLVHRYAFDEKGLTHSGRFVRTKKFEEENRAGRFLYDGAGSIIENSRAPKSVEAVNAANISLLPVNNELWALWEAAMPYSVDPTSLQTKGLVSLAAELEGIPFSAHPHKDRDGNIWNFGDLSYLGQSAIILYQLSPQGKLLQYKVVPAPQSYVHDFAVTDNHLVFYFPPIHKKSGPTFIDAMEWRGNEAGQLLVIDKNTLAPILQLPFDTGFIFHFGNAWQNNHTLTINTCWYPNADIMLRDVMNPIAEPSKRHSRSFAAQIIIDLKNKTARLDQSKTSMEFVQFDQRFMGQSTSIQYGVHASQNVTHGKYNCIASINTTTGQVDRYNLGNDFIAEEPLFVPSGPKQGEGYLVNTALNFKEGATYCMVFNAQHIADGPVAWSKLETYMPIGFHGALI